MRLGLARTLMIALVVLAPGRDAAAQSVAGDTAGLGDEWGTMRMLLERTFLKVDVLRLEVRVGAATAERIRSLVESANGQRPDESIVQAVLNAEQVWARFAFERDIDLNRLLEEIRKSMRIAIGAGLLDQADYESISTALPEWYAPIAERGIRDGDAQYYRIRGDTLVTEYIGREGTTWFTSTATARANRSALLASWFAPGSDFRAPLLASLPRR